MGPIASSADPERTAQYLIGLVGSGIQSSLTPSLHSAEAASFGLRDRFHYQLIDLDVVPVGADDIGFILRAAQALGFAGLNITHPVKQTVIGALDDLSPEAAAIGAVNTVVFTEDRAVGHNTDWYGFSELARRALANESTERVVQLGVGGAGSAVAYAQLRRGVGHLDLLDVDEGRAAELADSLQHQFGAGRVTAHGLGALPSLARGASGFVNTTPLGMAAHPGSAIPAGLIDSSHWVIDVVYLPLETQLLTEARERGARATGGTSMTVFQAADAFRLFTGRTPDSDRMLDHMNRLVRRTDVIRRTENRYFVDTGDRTGRDTLL